MGESWSIYIYKVLKEVYPDLGCSNNAMVIVNHFVDDMFDRVLVECANLCKQTNRSTLDARTVQTAIKFTFPREMAKILNEESRNAVKKYSESKAGGQRRVVKRPVFKKKKEPIMEEPEPEEDEVEEEEKRGTDADDEPEEEPQEEVVEEPVMEVGQPSFEFNKRKNSLSIKQISIVKRSKSSKKDKAPKRKTSP